MGIGVVGPVLGVVVPALGVVVPVVGGVVPVVGVVAPMPVLGVVVPVLGAVAAEHAVAAALAFDPVEFLQETIMVIRYLGQKTTTREECNARGIRDQGQLTCRSVLNWQ